MLVVSWLPSLTQDGSPHPKTSLDTFTGVPRGVSTNSNSVRLTISLNQELCEKNS